MCTTGYRRRNDQSFEAWFSSQLGALLSAPSPASFGRAFSSTFGSDARGKVAGSSVGSAGLQSALGALKAKWNAPSGRLQSASPAAGTDQNAAVELVWKLRGKQVRVYCGACCCEDGGGMKVDSLVLEGDPSLFK